MALAAKPKANQSTEAKTEAAVLQVINKGGSAAAKEVGEGRGLQHPLKFPSDGELWERLEHARSRQAIKLPRNTWILQAIHEKLEREGC